MYRDAKEVVRHRYRAVIEQGELQRAQLWPEQLSRLPPELRKRLDAAWSRMQQEVLTPAALANAEHALEDHRRLVVRAQKMLRSLRAQERREAGNRSVRRTNRVFSLLFVVVLGGPICASAQWFRMQQAEEECSQSAACLASGKCTADVWLSCVRTSSDDCRQTDGCRRQGWCSFDGHDCVAATAQDCAESSTCQEFGWCEPLGGFCVGDAAALQRWRFGSPRRR